MLEILALVFLGRKIREIVTEKGLKPRKYILIAVGLWFGLEISGIIVGFTFFGEGFAPYLLGLGGAVTGGIISYRIANNAEPAEEYPLSDEKGEALDSGLLRP